MLKNATTGLFFGSFNPIHIGHLALARFFLNETGLKEIWFVVSPQNPLKDKKSLLPEHHRLQLLKCAIDDEPAFKAIDIEFKMERPSYTIHTLLKLDELYPKKEFALLMGHDNLGSFEKWKNYQSILENYQIFVYPRISQHSKQNEISHPNIIKINAPIIEISSTYIRHAIANKKDVRFLLPDKAYVYLKEMHFYEKNHD